MIEKVHTNGHVLTFRFDGPDKDRILDLARKAGFAPEVYLENLLRIEEMKNVLGGRPLRENACAAEEPV